LITNVNERSEVALLLAAQFGAFLCSWQKGGGTHSGKKAVTRAKMLVGRGAEIIALASCMRKGNPIGFPCPHFQTIKEAVEKKCGLQ
jgi:predicted metal-binding protein